MDPGHFRSTNRLLLGTEISKLRPHTATVGWICNSPDEPVRLETIDKLSDVRANAAQPFRKLAQRQRLTRLLQPGQCTVLCYRETHVTKRSFDSILNGMRRVKN